MTLSPFDVASLDDDTFCSSDIMLLLVEISLLRTPKEVWETVFLVTPFAWTLWSGTKQKKRVPKSMVRWKSEAATTAKAQYAVCICIELKHFFVLAVSIAQPDDGVVLLDSNHDSVVPSNTHNDAVSSFCKLLAHLFPAVSTFSKRILMPEHYPQQACVDCSMHCAMAIDAIFKHVASKSVISLKKLDFRSPPAGWRSLVQGLLRGVQKENKEPEEEILANIQEALFSSKYTQPLIIMISK